MQARARFFSRLKPHCAHIPALKLWFTDLRGSVRMGLNGPPQPRPRANDPHLSDLVSNVAQTLHSVNIRYEPDALTAAALARCPHLQNVAFELCSVRTVTDILRGLPDLRKVAIRCLLDGDDDGWGDGSTTENLFNVLASNEDLEDIYFTATPYMHDLSEHVSARLGLALVGLFARTPRLKRLHLSSVPYATDDVLRTVARTCGDLEELALHTTSQLVTGLGILIGATTPWPRLRTLVVSDTKIFPSFVGAVVRRCEVLESVQLPRVLNQNPDIRALLGRQGFRDTEVEGGYRWKRG
ncbi:hypothetical protein BC936DRAFT_149022, partial [Jimgerdemannia flammicorona]